MEKQQRRAIVALALIVGAAASVAVPVVMDFLSIRSELAWQILAPGFLIFPVVHMPLQGLIMILLFDAGIYLFASYILAHVILRRWPEAHQ